MTRPLVRKSLKALNEKEEDAAAGFQSEGPSGHMRHQIQTMYKYIPKGVCSREIYIETDDNDTITNVTFVGGCNGNTKGVSSLVRGMKVDEVIERLEGIDCNMKGTSCPDQLARALKQMKAAAV